MAHPMGISLYMIVKDREKHIAACLKKINPLIDEIIIVDTGSTDATMAAAKKAGAKVYEYKKQDTGDSPRNYAVSLAEYEWILSMEIDEIIAPSDFTAIQELIRNENRDAYSFFLRQYSDDPEQENWFACTDDYTESN